jgi:hypothetical protein
MVERKAPGTQGPGPHGSHHHDQGFPHQADDLIMWQDWYFAFQNLLFAVIALPIMFDARNGIPVNRLSAFLFAVVQIIGSFVAISMGMWFMAIPFNAAVWIMVLVYSRKKSYDILGGNLYGS